MKDFNLLLLPLVTSLFFSIGNAKIIKSTVVAPDKCKKIENGKCLIPKISIRYKTESGQLELKCYNYRDEVTLNAYDRDNMFIRSAGNYDCQYSGYADVWFSYDMERRGNDPDQRNIAKIEIIPEKTLHPEYVCSNGGTPHKFKYDSNRKFESLYCGDDAPSGYYLYTTDEDGDEFYVKYPKCTSKQVLKYSENGEYTCIDIPKNSFKIGHQFWKCNDGYIQKDDACEKIPECSDTQYYAEEENECYEIPENAYKIGHLFWKCNDGYIQKDDACEKIPECNNTQYYVEDENKCSDIPPFAHKTAYNSWQCDNGFKQIDKLYCEIIIQDIR